MTPVHLPEQTSQEGEDGSSANVFFAPIFGRLRDDPSTPFGTFHQDGAWCDFTLAEVMGRARQFSELYHHQGVAPGELVFLVLRHGMDAYAAFLGAMISGLVPSFLPYPNVKQNHAIYWAQHQRVFAFYRPRILVVYDELNDAMQECVEGTGASVVPLSAVNAFGPALSARIVSSDAIALLQHSSGTTGLKKGVALDYRSIVAQLTSYQHHLLLDPTSSRIVSWLPLYHDMGLITSFLLPVWVGIPIIAMDPFVWVANPELFLDAAQRFRATHAWLPNFAFVHLARKVRDPGKWDLSSFRMIVNCSEPCKADAFDLFLERFGRAGIGLITLQTCYAMAETVFAVSQSDASRPVRRLEVDRDCIASGGSVSAPKPRAPSIILLSNGPPITGCNVRILRGDNFVGEKEIGEVCISANYLFSEYYRNEDATRSSFCGEWYRTGDQGFLQGGEVFIVGRFKEVIIVHGKNIFANDVEAAILEISGIKAGRCVAFGFYSESAGSEQLIVVAERSGEAEQDRHVIRQINNAVMDEIGVGCADISIVDQGWLIKTTSGKISRSENASRYAEAAAMKAARHKRVAD